MRRWAFLMALVLLLSLLGGCWDGQDLEKRSIALILGIDKTKAGVRVGLQLARPQAFSGSTAGSAEKDVVTVITREGPDVVSVLHDLQLAVDRQLFFGHVRVVVLGEEAARSGLWRHVHPLFGDAAVPRNAWLFVVRGTAEAILKLRPALDTVPATYLTHFFENRLLIHDPYVVTVGAFHQRWVTPGEEPIALWIAPGQPDQSAPTILGIAAFRDDHFVGGLLDPPGRGWEILQGQLPAGRLATDCPGRTGRFNVRILRLKARLRPQLVGGALQGLRVTVKASGRIEGMDCGASFSDPAEVARFESAVAQRFQQLSQQSLKRAQEELQVDIYGFGKQVHRWARRVWVDDQAWAKQFPRLPVALEISVKLDYTRSYRETYR